MGQNMKRQISLGFFTGNLLFSFESFFGTRESEAYSKLFSWRALHISLPGDLQNVLVYEQNITEEI